MFIITVQFDIKPEFVSKFMTAMHENASMSLNMEPGCHQFDVCAAPDDPSKVFLYEVYTDQAAFEAHKRMDHYIEFDETITDWVANKSVTRLQRTWP